MSPNLTSMTDGITSNFITTDGRSTSKFGESLRSRMAKAAMPSSGGDKWQQGHGTPGNMLEHRGCRGA